MKWMEFTTITGSAILVNISNIVMVRENSKMRTDIMLVGGFEVEVEGSYDDILKRMQDLQELRKND